MLAFIGTQPLPPVRAEVKEVCWPYRRVESCWSQVYVLRIRYFPLLRRDARAARSLDILVAYRHMIELRQPPSPLLACHRASLRSVGRWWHRVWYLYAALITTR